MMTMDDGLQDESRGAPPPLEESWWAAILQDEGREAAQARKKTEEARGVRKENLGCPDDWKWAQSLLDNDDTIELPVIGYNRGGLLVEARSLRGFVPVSHLVAFEPSSEEVVRSEQLSVLIGKNLTLKVIEHDTDRGRLVFSERAALAGPGKRTELLETLVAGECVRGVVTNILSLHSDLSRLHYFSDMAPAFPAVALP